MEFPKGVDFQKDIFRKSLALERPEFRSRRACLVGILKLSSLYETSQMRKEIEIFWEFNQKLFDYIEARYHAVAVKWDEVVLLFLIYSDLLKILNACLTPTQTFSCQNSKRTCEIVKLHQRELQTYLHRRHSSPPWISRLTPTTHRLVVILKFALRFVLEFGGVRGSVAFNHPDWCAVFEQ